MKKHVIILGFLLLSVTFLQAQKRAKMAPEQSRISIEGTSTLHDWEIEVQKFSGYADIETTAGKFQIQGGKVICKVASFESGKNSMNKEVYEAMDIENYPEVTYTYKKTKKIVRENDALTVISIGELTIAGTTQTITSELKGEYQEGVLKLEGSESFKMSSFGVEPPTVMFGTIKSGDKITINYSFIFNKQAEKL